jgi:hypothetical protein
VVFVVWWIAAAVLVALFLFWADRRTRGRGNKDSGGTADHATGKYV